MCSPIDHMREAIAYSSEQMHAVGAAPFAAVVVKDGKVIGKGVNQVVTRHDPTSHGEIEAIRDACRKLGTWDLSGCDLYTTCEPCELCVAAIHWSRISRLFYANTLADCEPIGLDLAGLRATVRQALHARALPTEQLLHDEAFAVVQEWLGSETVKRF